jgi:hypothetical protein
LPQFAIKPINSGWDVERLTVNLLEHPEYWNRHGWRKQAYAHTDMSDIWVRYNDIKNLGPHFNDEHQSVWYPVADEVPELKKLSDDVLRFVQGDRLGGVLITRIPPGGSVKPHIDYGWHARFYDKFAVQLRADVGQAFCFEGEILQPETGDLYMFDNSKLHWVVNDSPTDRVTMIICIHGARNELCKLAA